MLKMAEKPAKNVKPAVFLDRDGVLNIDSGYVYEISKFQWAEGALEAVKLLHLAGYYVFVVTNQSGIGRGLYSEVQFNELTHWIHEQVEIHGGLITATYFCPHHPTEGLGVYRKICLCRKPKTGMLKMAFENWPISKSESVLIGDKTSDLECAQNFGIRGILFEGGNLETFVKKRLGL